MSHPAEPELTEALTWTTEEIRRLIGNEYEWVDLDVHNLIVAKLKAELAESIPKARVQELQDNIKKEMEFAHKANTSNGNQSWQTLNMIRVQLDKLLSKGKEKGQ